MVHLSHPTLGLARLATLAALGLSLGACASEPPAPPAAAPPSHAFQQAASLGAAEAQGADDVQFVEQAHKEPTVHQDGVPATSLHAESQTTRPQPKP